MDLDAIRAEVRNRLSEDSADFWGSTQVDNAINQAIIAFSREERWPWLYSEVVSGTTLTVGVADVELPDDVDITRSFGFALKDDTTYVFPVPRRVTPMEGFYLRRKYSTNGQPLYYYLVKGVQDVAGDSLNYTIRFAPAADRTYTVQYFYMRKPPLLSTGTNEPDMPEVYHEAVVAWATAALWLPELQGSQVKSGEQMAIYNVVLQNARRDLLRLGEDEEVVWGREQDEEERTGRYPKLDDTAEGGQFGSQYSWDF